MEIAKSGENQLPIVINVANFSKGNKPSLLTHSEFTTLFHEFGHTLHMIASENTYTNTSSMAVEWDFIELPSQLLENWCWLPDFLKAYANHFKSGENIDEKTLNSLIESKNFMAAFGVLRQIELGSLDLALHQKGDFGSVDEIQNFCDSIHQQFSTFGKVDHNYLFASFSHIFAGGYASGYYSYLWAEVLEAQVFERFEKKPFDEELGRNFYEKVLAVGARKKAIKIFEDFLCTKPDPQALIKRLKFM
jgi:peptidyl-dipeptidase Dcp